jgi:rod shape-determining protein MreC
VNKKAITAASVAGFVLFVALIIALSPQNTRRVQAAFLSLISPFLKTGSTLDKKYRDYREGLKSLEQLEEEAKQLRVVNKELSATNQTLRGYEAENKRLRNALGFRERATFKLMPARIIARAPSTWYNQVTIDRGSADDIREDMAVLTEEGLVGKTTVVSARSTIVVLVADESCRVAATVEGTREQGIVKGERISSSNAPVLSLNFLAKTANLTNGQKIFSSGMGGVFPGGVAIGAVKDFKVRELDGFAYVVPAVDLTTLQDVFVVVSKDK